MRRKTVRLVVMLALLGLTAPLAAHAQPSTKVYRIGVVKGGTASASTSEDEAFTQRLRELGYTAGQNLVIEWRFADGQAERYPALVAELVRLPVDCLVVGGTEVTRAAKQATSTIPIVMSNAAMIPCVRDSSPAWHARAAISPASSTSRSNSPANAWNC